MKKKYNQLKITINKIYCTSLLKVLLIVISTFLFCQFSLTQDTLKFKIINQLTEEIITNVSCKINGIMLIPLNHTYHYIAESDSVIIEISAFDYKEYLQILSTKDFPTNFRLVEKQKELEEVEIIATTNQDKNFLTNLQLTQKEIELLPTFLGENDPVKVIQLLPGVQSGVDGNGIFIRGGNSDQNLLLYDDVPLYNISHLFGFFSVFNSNAIKSIDIYKNTFPAKYGGRVSSVVDIKSQPGNLRKWNTEANIGVLATSIHIDGPIKNDTSAISLSIRRTYIDLFQKLLSENSQLNATNYYFYDVNFNYNKIINQKNKLYISGFTGKDNFIYKDQWNLKNLFENRINWTSKFVASRLEHTFNSRLAYKLIAAINSYNLNFGASIYNFELNLSSNNRDYISKLQFDHSLNKKLHLNYGLESIFHEISPNNYQIQGLENASSYYSNNKLYSLESALFIHSNYELTEKLSLNIGFRYSIFNQLGPFTRTDFNSFGEKIISENHQKGKIVQTYFRPEPRIDFNFHPSQQTSFTIGVNQSFQYLHLAPISSLSLPTDIWVSSSSIIKPQQGNQISIGFEYKFKTSPFVFTVESYYKKMKNLIEYKQGVMSLTVLNNNYDDNFFFGKGESYGIEFFTKKTVGKLNGWISYTLSKSTRTFEDIENGRTFFAKNDRRHNVSLVANYEFNKKWALSAVLVFQSGNAITIPLSNYFIQGNIINTYSPKNSFRLPPYHRGDISLTYLYKNTDRKESSLNFSIYNFYGRQNPFYYYFETSGNLDKLVFETKLKQVTLITFLPSVSWKIKFK